MDIEADNKDKLNAFLNKGISPEFLAGFIDGDGNIYIRKQKAIKIGTNDYFQVGVEISQSRTNILQVIALHYGGKIYQSKRAAAMIIDDIMDHLVIKHKQAELVRKIIPLNNKSQFYKEKLALYKECSKLNSTKLAVPKYERVTKAYMAGIFDAEGSCSIRKRDDGYRGIRVKLTQTSYPKILTKIKEVLNIGKIVNESNTNHYWKTENFLGACKLFHAVIPYIVVKLNQVDAMIDYIETDYSDQERRQELYEKIYHEKHTSEDFSKDFKLCKDIYNLKIKKEKEEFNILKHIEHKKKVTKQYAEKSKQMKGAGNWNFGKERTLEHSYKISNSKSTKPKTLEEFKKQREDKEIEKEIKLKITPDEIRQRGIQKCSVTRRKATANEVIQVLKLTCEGKTEPGIVQILKDNNTKTKITVDSVKNIKALKTIVTSLEPEHNEYNKIVEYYKKNKDNAEELKRKIKAQKNSLGRRAVPAKVIIEVLKMYKENTPRKIILQKAQLLYPDLCIKENTIKGIRSNKTKVLEHEPEYAQYISLRKQFA